MSDGRSRRRKLARVIVVVFLVAGLLSLPLLNLFLASSVGRGLVARKVSGAMRLPVVVGGASYTPWGGIKLKNVRVDQVEAAGAVVDEPYFAASSFDVDLRLLSLLGDEVKIDRLVCDAPVISIVRQTQKVVAVRDKKVPGKVEKKDVEKKPEVKAEEKVAVKPTPRPRKSVAVKRRKKLVLGEVEIREGGVRVTTSDGKEMLRVDGVRMNLDFSEGIRKGSGRLEIDRAVILGAVEVTDFASPLRVEGKRMILESLAAVCESGTLTGDLVFERHRGQEPFLLNLVADGVEISKLLEGRALGIKSGVVNGRVAMRGTTRSMRSLEGNGSFELGSVVMMPDPELSKVRNALKVDRDGNVELDPAEATFAVRGGAIALKEASFGSGGLLVKAVGGIRFDGTMNVATRFYLGESVYGAVRSKPVVGRSELVFERLFGTDWYFRDETVTGNVRDPLVDFWRTGEPVSIGDVVRDLSFDFPPPGGDAIGS